MTKPTHLSTGLIKDVIAGLVQGVASVPSGLASAALAGVNPIAGIYTSALAPLAGGLLVSAQRMHISATAASALAAGEAIGAYPQAQRMEAMALVTVAAGAFLALFSLLRVGRLMKYVSQAVMTGFLTAVAVVVVLDQTAPLVGYDPPEGSKPFQMWSLLTTPGSIHLPTVATGVTALAVALLLARTRLAIVASILAMVVPTLLVLLLGWSGVRLVADAGGMDGGLPLPRFPSLGVISLDLLLSALALAAIIAIQGAGISQSLTNIDDKPISVDRDILAQSAGNVVAGLFSGIPAGGSVGQTALHLSAGAQTRWASVFCGLWVMAILLFLSGLVGYVPMAALAALMIIAGIGAIDVEETRTIWTVGWTPRLAAAVTFLAGLFFSLTIAIVVGVALSATLALVHAANDVRLRWLHADESGDLIESPVPAKLDADHDVMVINVYGSLFFAGARTLAERLPRPAGADRPVVILRLRGHSHVGATLVDVLDDYAADLKAAGGRLYLTGLEPRLMEPLTRVCRLVDDNDTGLYVVTNRLGHSTRQAVRDAKAWRYESRRRETEAGAGEARIEGGR